MVTTSGALDGVRVLDLSTGVAGPLAATLLADHGADAVKVEPPEGDQARAEPGFAVWNRGKRGLVVDHRGDDGARRLQSLLAGADLCVVSAAGDDLAGTVLDPSAVTASHPGLVYVHTPPYLADTPWAGGHESHALLAAATGVAMRQVSHDEVPVDLVYPHSLYAQGSWAAACAVAALLERRRSGSGQTVTVSGVHGALITSTGSLALDPAMPPRVTATGPGGPNPCYTRYACADGRWLFLAALTPKFQRAAFDALGLDGIVTAERIAGDLDRLLQPDNRDWVRARIAAAFAGRDRATWLRVLADAGCPAGPVDRREDWLDHPQIDAIGMRVELDDPDRGRVMMPGVPLVLTRTPGRVRGPAPRLGQHENDVLEGAWAARPPHAAPGDGAGRRPAPGGPPAGRGPLAGYRVVDLGTILAGPYAGMLLAELGADVVKVEPPSGDSFRERGFTFNRGMRGLALDLRDPRGRDTFDHLVRGADVVVDNYRPGVLERLGITYADLGRVNPDAVALSNTGYGEGGPLSGDPGFDPILQARSGMMEAQGGDDEPVFHTIPVNDVAGAALLALGACLALHHRERTGEGQRGWTSLAGIAAFMQCGELVRHDGRVPAPRGGRDHPGPGALDRFFATADGWVRVQASASHAVALRRAGLLAPSAADDGRRQQGGTGDVRPEDLGAALAVGLRGLGRDEAVRRLTEAGVPAAAARRFEETLGDAEWLRHKAVHHQVRPDGTAYVTAGRFAWFSRTQRDDPLVAPGIGEHSRAVLTEERVPAATVDALIADGIVAEGEPMHPRILVDYR